MEVESKLMEAESTILAKEESLHVGQETSIEIQGVDLTLALPETASYEECSVEEGKIKTIEKEFSNVTNESKPAETDVDVGKISENTLETVDASFSTIQQVVEIRTKSEHTTNDVITEEKTEILEILDKNKQTDQLEDGDGKVMRTPSEIVETPLSTVQEMVELTTSTDQTTYDVIIGAKDDSFADQMDVKNNEQFTDTVSIKEIDVVETTSLDNKILIGDAERTDHVELLSRDTEFSTEIIEERKSNKSEGTEQILEASEHSKEEVDAQQDVGIMKSDISPKREVIPDIAEIVQPVLDISKVATELDDIVLKRNEVKDVEKQQVNVISPTDGNSGEDSARTEETITKKDDSAKIDFEVLDSVEKDYVHVEVKSETITGRQMEDVGDVN